MAARISITDSKVPQNTLCCVFSTAFNAGLKRAYRSSTSTKCLFLFILLITLFYKKTNFFLKTQKKAKTRMRIKSEIPLGSWNVKMEWENTLKIESPISIYKKIVTFSIPFFLTRAQPLPYRFMNARLEVWNEPKETFVVSFNPVL